MSPWLPSADALQLSMPCRLGWDLDSHTTLPRVAFPTEEMGMGDNFGA